MKSFPILQTNDKCSFCLAKLTHSNKGEDDNGVAMELNCDRSSHFSRFPLRQIARHFKTHFQYEILLLRHHRKEKDEECNFPSPGNDLEVFLCNKCTVLAKCVSNFCQELELAQMRVDHLIQELLQKLVHSYGENTDGTEDSSGFLGKMCKSQWQKFAPSKFQISRQLKVKLNNINRKPSPIEERTDGNVELPTAGKLENQIQAHFDNEEKTIQDEPALAVTRKATGTSASTHQCPFCSSVLSSRVKLRYHMTIIHPAQFLSVAKQDDTSEEKFQSLCRTVLQEQLLRVPPAPNGDHICPHCENMYKKRNALSVHLVEIHYQQLCERLTELQLLEEVAVIKSSTANQKEDNRINISASPSTAQVHPFHHQRLKTNCKKRLVPPAVATVVAQCFNKLQTKTIQEGSLTFFVCALCPPNETRSRYTGKRSYERHVFNAHSEYFFMSLKSHAIPHSHFKGICERTLLQLCEKDSVEKKKVRCRICSDTFVERRFLLPHQIQYHYRVISEKLVEQLPDSVAEKSLSSLASSGSELNELHKCRICGVAFISKKSLSVHKSRAHPLELEPFDVVGRKKCGDCSKWFSCQASLNRHQKLNRCLQMNSWKRQQMELSSKIDATGSIERTAAVVLRQSSEHKVTNEMGSSITFHSIYSVTEGDSIEESSCKVETIMEEVAGEGVFRSNYSVGISNCDIDEGEPMNFEYANYVGNHFINYGDNTDPAMVVEEDPLQM